MGRNFVLVHGAFHGGWCWRETSEALRDRGHRVVTPTLTGLGERAHLVGPHIGWDTFITDILQVLRFEELDDVVLVGHSFSGGTITGVADRARERLRQLIYFDAMVLQSGQSALDTAPPELIASYRTRAMETSGGVTIPPNPPAYYGITDPVQADWLQRMMTPHPWSTYSDPLLLKHPVGHGLPAAYVACTCPALPATAGARTYAQGRPDWTYTELDEPHSAMVTSPQKVAALLERLAD